jgi:hypothetical protein
MIFKISLHLPAKKFCNELFAQTLMVRTTISGRAPLAVDAKHVVIIDRSGMTINVHKNDVSQFPLIKTLKVMKFYKKKINKNT